MKSQYYIWYDDNGKGHRRKRLICKYCGHEAPNKDFLRGKKCLACDGDYHLKLIEAEIERKKELEKWNDPEIAY